MIMEKLFQNFFPAFFDSSYGFNYSFFLLPLFLTSPVPVTNCHLFYQYLISNSRSGKPDKTLYGFPDEKVDKEVLSGHYYFQNIMFLNTHCHKPALDIF